MCLFWFVDSGPPSSRIVVSRFPIWKRILSKESRKRKQPRNGYLFSYTWSVLIGRANEALFLENLDFKLPSTKFVPKEKSWNMIKVNNKVNNVRTTWYRETMYNCTSWSVGLSRWLWRKSCKIKQSLFTVSAFSLWYSINSKVVLINAIAGSLIEQ